MHEYVQKSTSTTLPRSCASVSGFVLIQAPSACKRRRDAVVGQACALRRLADGGERLACRRAPSTSCSLRGRVVLDVLLQARRVTGRERREVVVDVEDEPERDEPRSARPRRRAPSRRARRSRPASLAPPRAISSIGSAAPSGVGERQQDGAQADVVVRRDDRDRREHRACARDEDEAERRAEEEAAAAPLGRKREKTANGRSISSPSAWDEQRHGDHEEERRSRGCAGSPPAGRAGRAATRRRA